MKVQFGLQVSFRLVLSILCLSLVSGRGGTLIDTDSISVVVTEEADDCDRVSQEGDYVIIKYTAEYTDTSPWEQFDDSSERDEQEFFRIGQHRVMKGWEEGLVDMCVGEKRDLYLSGEGLEGDLTSRARTPDKSRLTTVYHFELLKIMKKPPPVNVFKMMDFDKDNIITKDEMTAFFTHGGMTVDRNADSLIDKMFDTHDIDRDGMISFDEYPGQKDADE